MEISPTESEELHPLSSSSGSPQEPKRSEQVGRICFLSCSIVAFSAFIPAALKKNRVYTPLFPNIDSVIIPTQTASTENISEVLPHLLTPECTEDEKRVIAILFSTIATSGLDIAWKGIELRRLGNKINHVHPFSLLLAMPRDDIRTIFRSNNILKTTSVLGGIDQGMKKELARENIERYIPDFALKMGKEEDEIRQLIHSSDWKKLVHYLFDLSA